MKKLLAVVFALLTINSVAQESERLSLLFVGDIMQHDSQINDAWVSASNTFNYDPCFQHVKPYIEQADLAIGNLEVTLAGRPYKGYPQFSAPDELLVGLKNMGMDVLVTANNHCVDRGRKGLERTIRLLDSLKVPHTGTFVNQHAKDSLHPLLLEAKGFKLALLNYTYGTNGLPVTAPNIVNMIEPEKIVKDLALARSMNTDAIIVFVHWGSEYQSLPSPWQKDIAKLFFKNGADIVIGAHPHVIQPMEWDRENDQFIAYSLGNFVSGQRKRYTDGGAMIRLELVKDENGVKIDNPEYILEWVERDVRKNYFVWPAPLAEEAGNQGRFNTESASALKTFLQDSRDLLSKHNKMVPESKTVFKPKQ